MLDAGVIKMSYPDDQRPRAIRILEPFTARLGRAARAFFDAVASLGEEEVRRPGDRDIKEEDSTTEWNRFKRAALRVRDSAFFSASDSSRAPYGSYNERPIIGECTPIHGGIFLGAVAHEAIVIDEKYGKLQSVYDDFKAAVPSEIFALQATGDREKQIAGLVFQYCEHLLPWDPHKVQRILEREKLVPDRKVTLDIFIRKKCGLARHQVLLAAYLLEKLRLEGTIQGVPAIDARLTRPQGEDEQLLFTAASGEVFKFVPKVTPLAEAVNSAHE